MLNLKLHVFLGQRISVSQRIFSVKGDVRSGEVEII